MCDPNNSASCTGASGDVSTKYTYTAGSQYQSAVLDAGAHSLWPLSDSAPPTAYSAVISNEGSDNASYSNVSVGTAGPFSGSSATAAAFNGTSSYVTLPNSLVTGAQYLSIGMWFKTSTAGGILFDEENQPFGSSTTPTNATPSLYVGTDGKLHGQWYVGSISQVVSSATVTNGAWHLAVLSGAGNTQTLYLDGVAQGSVSGTINNLAQSYTYVGGGYSSAAWPQQPAAGWNHFTGSIADVFSFSRPLVAADVSGLYAAGTRSAQLLTTITRPSGKTYASVSYDGETARVVSVTDENGGTWRLYNPTVTGTSDAYRSAVMGSGPAGYYRMADTAGASSAYSEVNYGAGTYNNVTLGVAGPFSDRTAASFDGSSSYLQLPQTDQVSTGPNSIELWFKMAAGSTGGGVLFDEEQCPINNNPTCGGWDPALYVGTDGRLHGQFWINNISTATVFASAGLVNDGSWHHVVLSATTSSQSMYLDGNAVQVTGGGTSVSGTLSATALGYIYVGAGESGGAWPFHPTNTLGYFPGSIAELAFYRSALSAQQVAQHYAAYKSGVAGVSPTQVNGVAGPGTTQVTVPFDGTTYNASAVKTWTGPTSHLVFQADGNLVLSRNDNNAVLWSSNTAGNTGATLSFQSDGNLVLYNGSSVLWAANTEYSPNNSFVLRADGNAEIDAPSGHQKWNAGAALPTAANVLTYKYDAINGDRLISETDGTGAGTTYGYDTSGFLYTTTDADGDVTTTGHDVRGNEVSQTTCQNQAAQVCSTEYFTYYPDDTTAILTTADARNDLTTSFRDGRSSSATDNTYATTYTYDTAGDRTAVTTPAVPGFPAGRATTVTYSTAATPVPAADTGNVPSGLPLTTTSPGGSISRVAYLHNGDVASTTDADGQTTTYTYDGIGRVLTKTVSPGGPAAWWRLNQTSGTAVADATQTGNGATQSNVTWSGGAGVFNGTSSQITAGSPVVNTGASFTLSAWVNLPSVPANQADVISLSGNNQYSAFLQYSTYFNAWAFVMTSADVPYSATTPTYFSAAASGTPATGTWTHLVGVYDASANTSQLYVNGALAGSSHTTASWAASKNLTVGAGAGQYYFNGSIANVQAYQRALSATDVSTLYGAGYAGSTVSNTTPSGLVTTLTYDKLGQVTAQVDPAVTNRVTGAVHTATTTTTYDADGDVTAQTVADSAAGGDSSRTVSGTYDAYDQRATSTDANGNVSSFSYDAYGNKVSETAPDGNVTSSSYDSNGKLLTQSLLNYTGDPLNPSSARTLTEVSKAYDPAGRLASSTDSMGNVTSYTYTDNGLVATVTRSDSAGANRYVMQSTTYDAVGNVVKKVTGNGSLTTTYTVDAADRTTQSTVDPTGTARSTVVSFTPNDEVATSAESDPSGASRTAKYTYDPMGNKTSQSLAADATGHPVGWWPLNQTTGTTVTDASGTGNTANASGATWTGSSASFTGAGGQGVVTNGPVVNTASSFSVSAWAQLNSTGTWQDVAAQDGTNDSGFELQYDVTDSAWAFSRTATDTTNPTGIKAHGTTKPSTGTWYHLVGTYNSSTGAMTLYVNGAAAGTATDSTPFTSSGGFTIGRGQYNASATDWLNGQAANVQAYNRVLSASEVSALYSGGRTSGTVASSPWQTTSWTRDVRGLPLTMTDPNGNLTGYTYDEAGHLAQTVAPTVTSEVYGSTAVSVHPVTTVGYDAFGEEAQSEDANGNIVTTAYDANGNKVSQTLPPYTAPGGTSAINATTTWAYDKNDSLTSETDPAGNVTSYVYDQVGDTAKTTTPDGGVTHSTYDTNGDNLSTTTAFGAQTQATYDWLGRRLTDTTLERYPTAQTLTTSYSYTPSTTNPGGAQLGTVTSARGVAVTYGYDAAGEKISSTDPAGNVTRYSYTFDGNPSVTTYPDGSSSETDYNAADQVTATKAFDAGGALLTTQSATYDGDGNALSSTDARGDTSTYTYDAMNTVTQEVQPVSATSSITTSFGYDAAGNRTRYTDGRGNNWYTTYNTWGAKETQVEPTTSTYTTAAASTTTYAYNADGQLANETLPGGATQSFTYDSMGDLLTQSGAGAAAASATRTFGYDLGGRVTSAATSNTATGTSNATSESFTYDDRGNLLTAAGSAGSTTMAYNADGLPTSRADASGTTSYTYDTADRVSTTADAATGATLTYGYNSLNQVASIGYGTGQDTRSYTYDSLHRLSGDTLKTSSGATVASIGYGYDADGNLTSKNTSGFAASASNTYTYDFANRLASWNNGSSTTAYSYDAAGNRTQVGSNVYTYDARDQLTGDGVNSYSYTAAGTLANQSSASASASFSSDAYGQEVGAGVEAYVYDALGRAVTRTDTSTSASSALQYSGVANLVASDGSYTYTRDSVGALLGVNTVGGTTATGQLALTDLHTDMVGSFSPAGSALAGSATYDPLGNAVGAPTKAGNLGYQSEFTDSGTGQVNMAARWYNPAVGQFTGKDTVSVNPLGNSANANPFAYAADDPMTGTDPSGHCWICNVFSSAVDTVSSNVSSAWDSATSWASSAWDSASNFVEDDLIRPARHFYQAYVAPVVHAVVHYASVTVHRVSDAYHRATRWVRRQASRAWHAVKHAYHAAVHYVKSAYHAAAHAVRTAARAVGRAAKSAVTFVKHHAAAIASMALSTVAFMGCEAVLGAMTGGVGAVAGAV